MSLTCETKGPYLRVWFDTPNSEINIFDHPTAEALTKILAIVDPRIHKAVLFLSSKPASYINGVGLLLASAIKNADEAIKLTAPTRQAYLAVKNCIVPTVAVVKGSCFGCGVEFISHCTYRVAVESLETTFYMTEIPEYIFVPAFGGTQLLPPLVGLEKATDLILWGEKWDTPTAKRFGLLNETVPLLNWERNLEKLLPKLIEKKMERKKAPKKTHESLWTKTEGRILSLPPSYQKPYHDAYHLLQIGAAADAFNELTSRRELKASMESVMRNESKMALSFFFVRQSARLIAEKGRLDNQRAILNLRLPKAAMAWGRSLVNQDPESFSFKLQSYVPGRAAGVFLETGNSESIPFYVGSAPLNQRRNEVPRHGVYWPGYQSQCKLVEIRNVVSPLARAEVAFCFHKMGFTTVVSHGEGGFFLDELWKNTVGGLASLCEHSVSPEEVIESLCDFGFLDFPATWAKRFGTSLTSSISRAAAGNQRKDPQTGDKVRAWAERLQKSPRQVAKTGTSINPIVVKTLVAWWMSVVVKTFSDSKIAHLAFADVAAREMLGFPLSHLSLSRFATKKWLRSEVLASHEVLGQLPPEVADPLRYYTDFETVRSPRQRS